MSNRICCICKSHIESDNPSVLTVSSFGIPRFLCDSCDSDFSLALGSKDYDEIKSSISTIGGKMEDAGVEDELVIEEVGAIVERATERAEAILDGSYDFSLDEEEEEEQDEQIPEQTPPEEPEIETEEQKERRLKKEKTLKIVDIVSSSILGAAVIGFAVYFLIKLVF